jgi:hypothetical protein
MTVRILHLCRIPTSKRARRTIGRCALVAFGIVSFASSVITFGDACCSRVRIKD